MNGRGYWSAIEINGLWCVIAGGKVFSGGKKKKKEEEEAILLLSRFDSGGRGNLEAADSLAPFQSRAADQTVDVRSSGGIITGGHRGKDDDDDDDEALCR